jgi:hypothetical protein
MEMALTLVSIASFFALVLAWTVLPATSAPTAEVSPAPGIPSPQAVH